MFTMQFARPFARVNIHDNLLRTNPNPGEVVIIDDTAGIMDLKITHPIYGDGARALKMAGTWMRIGPEKGR